MVLSRRLLLPLVLLSLSFAAAPAWAAGDPRAVIKAFGDQLVAAVNAPGAPSDKPRLITPSVEQYVDVPLVAKFCLGRYWKRATADQQTRYIAVFHDVMVNAIAGHMGEYSGVSYVISAVRGQDDDVAVTTDIERPKAPPVTVQWVVSAASGKSLIVDVIAEGTSMRLTQRQDYASFLGQHNGDIDQLIAALQDKVKQGV
jgi:phospholipid transport system substrate-binding protein